MVSKQALCWQGYLRADGRKGIRNKILVIYTVECASFVAKSIAAAFPEQEVEVIGFAGCTDNEYAVRMLLALGRHPNVGAVLVVGLGCEYIQARLLSEKISSSGRLTNWLLIQQEGGTTTSVQQGKKIVARFLHRLATESVRVDMALSDLVIGAECGGSDFTSGLAGNVVVGHLFDLLVDAGGTAIFEEIVEAVGLREQLAARGRTGAVADALRHTYDKALAYCKAVRQYSISPGNFVGGLTTIEEKSMGALVKSGSRFIEGVLRVSERPEQPGLWLLDSTPDTHWMNFGYTNPNDNEGIMDLISCGAQIVFLVTGRGNVVGSAVAPVLKITGNRSTYECMQEDMDFFAGDVLTGRCNMEELTNALLEQTLHIAAGRRTKAELLGHKEFFIPYKYQNINEKRCR